MSQDTTESNTDKREQRKDKKQKKGTRLPNTTLRLDCPTAPLYACSIIDKSMQSQCSLSKRKDPAARFRQGGKRPGLFDVIMNFTSSLLPASSSSWPSTL